MQAIEAKEEVDINNETVTLASISYQNFFRAYPKLSGMSGTASTEIDEFSNIYNMSVQVPRPLPPTHTRPPPSRYPPAVSTRPLIPVVDRIVRLCFAVQS